jgi:hypothetical protein
VVVALLVKVLTEEMTLAAELADLVCHHLLPEQQ